MLPQLAAQPADERMSVAELARRPLADLEAGISLELDRIQSMSDNNPLAALDEIIGFMQAINTELLKSQAPMLIESAQQRATQFHATNKVDQISREESAAIASMHRTQEAVVKLGVARAKVIQVIGRSYPASSQQAIPEPEQRALPESTHMVIDMPEAKLSMEPVRTIMDHGVDGGGVGRLSSGRSERSTE